MWRRNLILSIVVFNFIILGRLGYAAIQQDNFKGLILSYLQVLVVSFAVYISVKRYRDS